MAPYQILKVAFLGLLLTAFVACDRGVPPPANMLSEEQMVSVLVELHLAEARASLLQIKADSIRPLVEKRYTEIFTKMNVDSAAFNATFDYYEHYPERMDLLYEKVVVQLVEREAKYRTETHDSTAHPMPTSVDSLQ